MVNDSAAAQVHSGLRFVPRITSRGDLASGSFAAGDCPVQCLRPGRPYRHTIGGTEVRLSYPTILAGEKHSTVIPQCIWRCNNRLYDHFW